MSTSYDSLRAWVDEFERRRAEGHELLWADAPKVKRSGWGVNHQESSYGFMDLADDTHHEILVPVAMKGFKELPFMEPLLNPKYSDSYWSIPVADRPPSARARALKEGLRAA